MNLDYVLFPIRNLYFITYIELKYYIRCCGPLPIDVPNLAEVGDGPFHPWVRVFSSTLLAAPDPLPFAVTFSFTTVKILFFSFNLPSEALVIYPGDLEGLFTEIDDWTKQNWDAECIADCVDMGEFDICKEADCVTDVEWGVKIV